MILGPTRTLRSLLSSADLSRPGATALGDWYVNRLCRGSPAAVPVSEFDVAPSHAAAGARCAGPARLTERREGARLRRLGLEAEVIVSEQRALPGGGSWGRAGSHNRPCVDFRCYCALSSMDDRDSMPNIHLAHFDSVLCSVTAVTAALAAQDAARHTQAFTRIRSAVAFRSALSRSPSRAYRFTGIVHCSGTDSGR